VKAGCFAIAFLLTWILPAPVLAHGLGGRQDLPVPLEFFVVGAGAVLVLSFVALAVLWPRPRMQESPAAGAGPANRWVSRLLGWLGMVGLAIVIVAGMVGEPTSGRNPGPVLVFVVFWLVVPFVSAVVGDIYPQLDPWKRLRGLLGVESGSGLTQTVWPATIVFVAFTWLELVSPWQDPFHLAIAALVYTAYLIVMGMAGRSPSEVDGFAVYNRLLGAMAPWWRRDDGTVTRVGWLRALPHLPEQAGLVTFVVAMIGTVTHDGASGTDWWAANIELRFNRSLFDLGLSPLASSLITGTVTLLATVGVIWLAYLGASALAARLGGSGTARMVAVRFAHTLVPIAFAYAFAHYFTLVLFEGQLVFSTLSDPFGLGWNLLGAADRPISYALIQTSASWVWYVQVAVIVLGHIAGVVLAHDRALADFKGMAAVRSQYAMLLLMVVLTGLGLVILSAG